MKGIVPAFNPPAYLSHVYAFLGLNLQFKDDPPFTELVRHPREILAAMVGEPMPARGALRFTLSPGEPGISESLAAMSELAINGAQSPEVIGLAGRLATLDLLGMAPKMAHAPLVDCDDVATLGAALLLAAGIPPVFIVTGRAKDRDPGTGAVKLRHVFYGARIGDQVMPFDPQERVPPGRWPRLDNGDRLEFYDVLPKKK